MAQTVTQRLRESGDLTASTWDSLAERMTWKMRDVTDWMTSNPGQKVSEIPFGPNQNIAYSYGTWAHAWLSNEYGADTLLNSFYPTLNDLAWEGSFSNAYEMSSTAFLVEFDKFVDLPLAEQLKILP